MSSIPVLKKLERKKTGMTLLWSDGFEAVVEYKQLRYWCPCAKCAPKRDSEATAEILTSEVSKYKSGIPEVKKVGGYALQFDWSNGCSSGIYRFERLWSLANKEDPDQGRPYVHGAW